MWEVVPDLVESSFKNTYYPRAASCLEALRAKSMEHNHVQEYNTKIAALESKWKGSEFWTHLSKEGSKYRPISSVEHASSSLGAGACEAMFEVGSAATTVSTGINGGDEEEDDIWDDLE